MMFICLTKAIDSEVAGKCLHTSLPRENANQSRAYHAVMFWAEINCLCLSCPADQQVSNFEQSKMSMCCKFEEENVF